MKNIIKLIKIITITIVIGISIIGCNDPEGNKKGNVKKFNPMGIIQGSGDVNVTGRGVETTVNGSAFRLSVSPTVVQAQVNYMRSARSAGRSVVAADSTFPVAIKVGENNFSIICSYDADGNKFIGSLKLTDEKETTYQITGGFDDDYNIINLVAVAKWKEADGNIKEEQIAIPQDSSITISGPIFKRVAGFPEELFGVWTGSATQGNWLVQSNFIGGDQRVTIGDYGIAAYALVPGSDQNGEYTAAEMFTNWSFQDMWKSVDGKYYEAVAVIINPNTSIRQQGYNAWLEEHFNREFSDGIWEDIKQMSADYWKDTELGYGAWKEYYIKNGSEKVTYESWLAAVNALNAEASGDYFYPDTKSEFYFNLSIFLMSDNKSYFLDTISGHPAAADAFNRAIEWRNWDFFSFGIERKDDAIQGIWPPSAIAWGDSSVQANFDDPIVAGQKAPWLMSPRYTKIRFYIPDNDTIKVQLYAYGDTYKQDKFRELFGNAYMDETGSIISGNQFLFKESNNYDITLSRQ